jgi:hypothetical protein
MRDGSSSSSSLRLRIMTVIRVPSEFLRFGFLPLHLKVFLRLVADAHYSVWSKEFFKRRIRCRREVHDRTLRPDTMAICTADDAGVVIHVVPYVVPRGEFVFGHDERVLGLCTYSEKS